MKTTFESKLNAHVTRDDEGMVRYIRHSQKLLESGEAVPRESAESYLNNWADALQIPRDQLRNLSRTATNFEPREQGVEYQRDKEKHMFDSTTVGYYQTYMNTPVWRAGLSVKIKQGPNRIAASTNNSVDGLKGSLPAAARIEEYKKIFAKVGIRRTEIKVGASGADGPPEAAGVIGKAIGIPAATRGKASSNINTRSAKFFIYKYDPNKRYAGSPNPRLPARGGTSSESRGISIPKLPAVSPDIKAGRAYLVAEMIFTTNSSTPFAGITWLVLIEVETGSALYIESMTAGVNGLVFRHDPNVKTGDMTITSAKNNTVLNPLRDDVQLAALDAPAGGVQSLAGTYVKLTEIESPDVAAPTKTAGNDFDFNARTSEFGAVSAYYHQTELFKTIESLGFPVATYMKGTKFPIPVDFRAENDEINAHCDGDSEGVTKVTFGLCDITNKKEPLCRAVDPWVHWHEMGGHGILYYHLGNWHFEFAHSAGDGLAAIQMDPESGLRDTPERFRYAPFRPIPIDNGIPQERRFDRDVGTWAWGSKIVTSPGGAFISGDTGNDPYAYGAEQILATCHFRIYRSIGGDSANLGRRQFASRVTTYLILRTIGELTGMTNPKTAEAWCEEMLSADLGDWTSEGLSGGAYNKVIRWAFEKQGAFQPAGASKPVTKPGAPPDVDVYIDDGRHGEYEFQAVHWNNQSVWNRNIDDKKPGHQNAKENKDNFLYGKIKNRGTKKAAKVNVRAFHTKPGTGLTWPNDFVEMNPAGGIKIEAGVGPNNSEEALVGPFIWQPNLNALGHDCVLMIVSADGDPSNIENFTGSDSIQEWRLVPHDNNIGQRNVTIIPGGGGGQGLMDAMKDAFFMTGNNLNTLATMQFKVEMPKFLARKKWKLGFEGVSGRFRMRGGEKRRIALKLEKGQDFTAEEIRTMDDPAVINVSVFADDVLVGGMSYIIDPSLKTRSGGR